MSERKRTLSDSSITISTSQSPRSKRGVSELGDSNSDAEVSLGASHLHIMDPNDSPIDMGVESQSTAMPIDDAMERLPLYSEANGMNVVGTELEVFDDNLDAGEDSDDVIPSPDQQLKEIAQLCQRELVKGEDWYLISRLWYRRWQVACSGIAESKEDDLELGIDAVGPINSDSITDDEGNLKKPLLLDVEVVAVPKKAWQLLESWYVSFVSWLNVLKLILIDLRTGMERIDPLSFDPSSALQLSPQSESNSTFPLSILTRLSQKRVTPFQPFPRPFQPSPYRPDRL